MTTINDLINTRNSILVANRNGLEGRGNLSLQNVTLLNLRPNMRE